MACTYRIRQPGCYVLVEDILFQPNAFDDKGGRLPAHAACDPVYPEQLQEYPPTAYGIGFFAAITIEADDVFLDLNGHQLQQSRFHHLMQRFYAHVILGNAPFIKSKGPHDFGDFQGPSRVCITNGRCGRSSHHCVLGNQATDIVIKDMQVSDFEVAGVSINQPNRLLIQNLNIMNSMPDLRVIGTYSAARSIRPFVNHLASSNPSFSITLRGEQKNAASIRDALNADLDAVADEVLSSGRIITPRLVHAFGNADGLPESVMYGIVAHSQGPAVNGFQPSLPGSSMAGREVLLRNVNIMDLTTNAREVVALESPETPGKPEIDAVGAVFRTVTRGGDGVALGLDSERRYSGTSLSNAQLLIAKAHKAGVRFPPFDAKRSSISARTLDWAAGNEGLPVDAAMICNGDDMFHVMKGLIGVRVDGVDGATVDGVTINQLTNKGTIASTLCNDNEQYSTGQGISNGEATLPGYRGADVMGIAVSSGRNAAVRRSVVMSLSSSFGAATGLYVLGVLSVAASETGRPWASNAWPNQGLDPSGPLLASGARVGQQVSGVWMDRVMVVPGALTVEGRRSSNTEAWRNAMLLQAEVCMSEEMQLLAEMAQFG